MSAYFIDALRYQDPEGAVWRTAANAQDGAPAVITYAFMTALPPFVWTGYGDPALTFRPLGTEARDLVGKAMGLISAVANVRYVEVSESTDPNLAIGSYDMDGNIAGSANPPIYYGGLGRSELWLDKVTGAGNLTVILHELCHTLGLKHPFEEDATLPTAEDRMSNTVMSYTWDTDPGKLGVFDVIALQNIYGPAERRLGDNTYVFGKDKVIWDGGGRDLIDAHRASQGVTLSLEDGTWNHIGSRTDSFLNDRQVWLGDFTLIEDALGSSYRDRLSGNDLANDLKGGAGKDTLTGLGGRDDLWGGAGADRFVFTQATDSGLGRARDRIQDFEHGDHIDLSALDLDFRGSHGFTGAGGEVRVEGRPGNFILSADLDGDREPDFAIIVRGSSELDRGDLIL